MPSRWMSLVQNLMYEVNEVTYSILVRMPIHFIFSGTLFYLLQDHSSTSSASLFTQPGWHLHHPVRNRGSIGTALAVFPRHQQFPQDLLPTVHFNAFRGSFIYSVFILLPWVRSLLSDSLKLKSCLPLIFFSPSQETHLFSKAQKPGPSIPHPAGYFLTFVPTTCMAWSYWPLFIHIWNQPKLNLFLQFLNTLISAPSKNKKFPITYPKSFCSHNPSLSFSFWLDSLKM